MYDFLDQLGLMALTEQAVVFRMVLACLLGGVLGLERTRKGRAAGFRTYMLVCMGSAVAMMTGQFMLERFGGVDPSRIGAQVVSGIGFLGAGTILVTGLHQIKGLTTAAGLWAAACMGIALGIGFYFGALVMCALMLLVMTLFNYLQERFISRSKRIRLYVVFETLRNIADFLEFIKEKGIAVDDFETMRNPIDGGIAALFLFRFHEKKSHVDIVSLVGDCKGIVSIEEY